MLAPARCSTPPARQSILCTPTLPCIPLAFTAHDTELRELLRPKPLQSTEHIFCHCRLEFPIQLSLTTPAAAKKENSSDFSKGIFPPPYVWWLAGRLVTLHTRYFLFICPQWVTSTFRPDARQGDTAVTGKGRSDSPSPNFPGTPPTPALNN